MTLYQMEQLEEAKNKIQEARLEGEDFCVLELLHPVVQVVLRDEGYNIVNVIKNISSNSYTQINLEETEYGSITNIRET